MCEPQDVSALCLLISAGLEDEDWRASAMARGLERASYFTWQRCAAETVAAYKTVLGA
jgi:alpha-1,3-rhamnosyl/mannosyltransferase